MTRWDDAKVEHEICLEDMDSNEFYAIFKKKGKCPMCGKMVD